MNPAFWQGRKVFLTGHTGFKGAWLSQWLGELGATIHGYALAPPTQPNLFSAAGVESRLAGHMIADIRDLDALRQAVHASRPEIVIHMAAQSLVREGYTDPVGTYATNVLGTVNLLEAVRGADSVRVVLVVTTDKCYENREWPWGYREIDRLGGRDPYSSSKACAELVTAAYRSSFFNRSDGAPAVATARAGNVIGGGDWAKDRLVPDLVRAFIAGEQPLIRSPHAVRPWQHVLEPLFGYLELCERLWSDGARLADAWNFGPQAGDARSVAWIADRLAALWGGGAAWRTDTGRDHPHETNFLHLDATKATQQLGYHPRWRLEDALVSIVEWYKLHAKGESMAAVTCRQIADFERSVAAC